VVDPVNHP